MNLEEKLNLVGVKIPEIYFPNDNINLTKFSTIACDQYTEDIEYWNEVKKIVGESPSTYKLKLPEAELIELKKQNPNIYNKLLKEKANNINNLMKEYIKSGFYKSIGECMIFVERKASSVDRRGLILSIDLEKYDYNENSKSLIRATEKTVYERLLARKEIMKDSILDIPHTLILINDKEDKLFKKLEAIKLASFYNINGKSSNDLIYDFDLMKDSGYIKGYKISDNKDIEEIIDVLVSLKEKAEDGLLYAVGDGNHSLAAAKDIYKETGKGRYALVELVNIHDDGLAFFPIHRLLMNIDKDNFKKETGIDVSNPPSLQKTQKLIDKYLQNHKEVEIDYIHDKDKCIELGMRKNNLSIVFDKFDYENLFSDTIKYGSLCRKSFSMGEAKDKRFYLEAQKIQ